MINDRVRKILAGVRKQGVSGKQASNRFFNLDTPMVILDQPMRKEEEFELVRHLNEAMFGFAASESGAKVIDFGGFRIRSVGR